MSEEVARAIGDLIAENATLHVELAALLSDNAALVRIAQAAIECLRGLLYQDGTDTAIKRADRSMYGFEQALAAEHPGAALLAERDQIVQAARDLVGDLTLLPSRLWQFNGEALERDYQALKTLLDQAAQKAR